MEDAREGAKHSVLQDASLETALDALLSDYLDRLDVLFRAYAPVNQQAGPSSEVQRLKLHDEAVQRRNMVSLFENEMNVGGPSRLKAEDNTNQPEQAGLISLPTVLNLNDEEIEVWRRWSPEVDEIVLVYLSAERGYWPGKIIDLGYFSALALPRIPRHRMYAVRVYPTKQHPIITIKSHLVPFHLRPQTQRKAPSTLFKAYRTAESPMVYDIEALGLEVRNQAMWGTDPTGLKMDGRGWYEWKDWIEGQARLEGVLGLQGKFGGSVKVEALGVLHDLERRGYPIFTPTSTAIQRSTPSTLPDAIIIQQSSLAPPMPSKADYKRSRRRLVDALQDPLIGPPLGRLNLGEICRTLVKVRPSTAISNSNQGATGDPFSGLAPDNNVNMEDDQIQAEALDHVLGRSRKRKRQRDRLDDGDKRGDGTMTGFVDPLVGSAMDEDEEEGWTVVKRGR